MPESCEVGDPVACGSCTDPMENRFCIAGFPRLPRGRIVHMLEPRHAKVRRCHVVAADGPPPTGAAAAATLKARGTGEHVAHEDAPSTLFSGGFALPSHGEQESVDENEDGSVLFRVLCRHRQSQTLWLVRGYGRDEVRLCDWTAASSRPTGRREWRFADTLSAVSTCTLIAEFYLENVVERIEDMLRQHVRLRPPVGKLCFPFLGGEATFSTVDVRHNRLLLEADKDAVPPERLASIEFEFPAITLRLSRTFTGGTGGLKVWDATKIFAQWLARGYGQPYVDGSDVLELGAGLGLPGLVAATAACGSRSVVLTDFVQEVLDAVRASRQANADVLASPVEVKRFDWKSVRSMPASVSAFRHCADCVLASDVLYSEDMVPHLIAAIDHVLRSDGKAVLAFPSIRCGVPAFLRQLLREGFRLVEKITPPRDCDVDGGGVISAQGVHVYVYERS